MLDYENLNAAAEAADTSPHVEGWESVEGIDADGLTKFSAEQAFKDSVLTFGLSPIQAMAYGIVVGVRCANLALTKEG